ncbi:MAG TPA: hypothetical protein VIM74_04175 [Casimicrobiaceae bacterium]|jgi:hypothetical protein
MDDEKPKPPKPPKKTWREKLADLGNGIGDALGEALFGGNR